MSRFARFVVLLHELPPGHDRQTHYDLMLETGGRLLTWSFPEAPGPSAQQGERLADHRLEYLSYEGPVSGGRGQVRRWDGGRLLDEAPEGPLPERLELRISGQRLQGRLLLERAGDYWRCSVRPA